MASDLLEDPRARIESAADKHGQFLREAEGFVYRYVKGTLRGFDARDAMQFKLQLPKPTDSRVTGRPRVRSAAALPTGCPHSRASRPQPHSSATSFSSRKRGRPEPQKGTFLLCVDMLA